jgi:hemerythrin superfamily protein
MPKSPNALELLRKDHRSVLTLLRRFEKSADEREQRDLCSEILAELDAHTALEENCFYPYVRDATDRRDLIEEATIEHDTARKLMQELGEGNPDEVHFQALMKVLGEYVTLHVREEEERIFPLVEKLGIDLEALGQELAERMDEAGTGAQHRARGGAARADGSRSAGHREAVRRHGGAREKPARSGRGGQRNGEAGAKGNGDTTREDEAFLRDHGDELSRSAQHAKWIHSPQEHEDRPGQTLATRNPEVIRRWAEARNAQPATTPGGDAERPRVLRFDFPGYDRELQPMSWDAWLRTFEQRDLVFLFQEHMKAGNESNFFRLDNPRREEG